MTGQTNLPLQRAILLRLTKSCNLLICTVLSKLSKNEEKEEKNIKKKKLQYNGDRPKYWLILYHLINQEICPPGQLTVVSTLCQKGYGFKFHFRYNIKTQIKKVTNNN